MANTKPESRKTDERFWDYVDKTSREVASWPDWMKGGQAQPCERAESSSTTPSDSKQASSSKKD